MSALDTGQRVHLCLCSPWQNIIDCYREDDNKASIAADGTVWEMPDAYAVGDLVILVLQARERAIFNVEVMSADGASNVYDTEDSAGAYFTGVSVRAVELRMGEPFPAAPTTLDDDYAERLLDAIHAEHVSPTPWYITDITGCADGLQGLPWDAKYEVWKRQSREECLCCRIDFSSLPYWEYINALQFHDSGVPEDDTESLRSADSVVQLCASCHAIVHSPFAPSVEYLIYGWRPACPVCKEHHAISLIWGKTDDSSLLGSIAMMGAGNSGSMAEFRCGECAHEWSTNDVEGMSKT